MNGDGSEDGNENSSGDGNEDEDRNRDRDGVGTGTGTGTGVETPGRIHDGNGDGSGDGNESNSGDVNGHENGNGNGNEDRIGEGGGEAKKHKKPHKSCRRRVGNGGDLDGKRIKRRKERVGTVASHTDNLENTKGAGGGAQRTQSLSKDCTSRESVSSLSRLIRGFALSIIDPPLGGSMRVV